MHKPWKYKEPENQKRSFACSMLKEQLSLLLCFISNIDKPRLELKILSAGPVRLSPTSEDHKIWRKIERK